MPHVVLLVGLCGSGKTHHAEEYEKRGYVKLDEGYSAEDPAAGKHLSKTKFQALRKAVTNGRDCVFTEAQLMFEPLRQEFERDLATLRGINALTIEWVFFENNLEKAKWNCRNDPKRRDPKGSVANNERWAPFYTIPNGETVRKIHKLPKLKVAGRGRSRKATDP
jgi:hypothetical protein